MSRKLLSVSISTVLLGSTAMADVPSVAVDIAPVHSLVARVMDGVGTPNLIVQPGASPHGYNLRPSDAAALQEADVVFWIGEDLTPQLEDAIETLAANASVTELLAVEDIKLLDFRENALFEAHDHSDHDDHGHDDHDEHGHDDHDHGEEKHADHDDHDHDKEEHAEHDDHGHEGHDHDKEEHAEHDHEHDHDHDKEEHAEHDDHGHDDHDHDKEEHAEHDDHGHDDHDHDKEEHDDHGHDEHEDHAGHDDHAHGEHDPHAWLSPQNASIWLNEIAAKLSASDPDNAGAYFANAAAAREEMAALSAEISATLDPVRGGSFIVFHDAYQYFESDFDFPASGAISLGDATDPSPARIAEIQGRVQNEGVDCVLSEPQFNPGLVATVLNGTEASTGVIDPLGTDLEPGANLYPQLIRNMAKTLADCL
ncbi:MAG: zinc ABC transporter substrate-binding protein [Litoreibacter sp.]|nr:zinc ABC transporter substrate-binding protein [Litoreibacter sp.]